MAETSRKSSGPKPPRKAASEVNLCPYRKPTQVGWGKTPEVDERASVKELGKLTPYPRKKGGLSRLTLGGEKAEQAAGKGLKRLFTKNTGLCERASGSIGADSCPVPEGEASW